MPNATIKIIKLTTKTLNILRVIFIFLSNNLWKLFFLAILIFSIALRITDFDDVLIIKSDQARDLLIMNNLKNGTFSDIPLLGPQVGGTELRLGPITYYFQYFSGKLFGFTTESIAYPDLFFGIMTIPLLFFLFRLFFDKYLSLWLSALAGFSLLLVTFSRFAWNPNSLPFFTTLFTISFLKALEKEKRGKIVYLGLAAICIGIIGQLHLAAIIGLIFGLIIFFIFYKSLTLKEIAFMALVVIAVNLPVFINEWKTGWSNTNKLTQAFNEKESKESKHAIHEKIIRSYQENSRIFWLTITSDQNTDNVLTRGYSLKCNTKCRSMLPHSLMAMATLGYTIIIFYLAWKKEDNFNRKRRIFFIISWLTGFFIFSIFIAYQIETRFYLGIVVPFMIMVGFLAEKILSLAKNKYAMILAFIFGIGLLVINLYSTIIYLNELKVSRKSAEKSGLDLRFGTAPKVTLGQLRDIGNKANLELDRNFPTIVTGESLYVKAMYYVVSAENGFNGCYIRGNHDVPSYFNSLIIKYTDSTDKNNEFGTLSATFKKADESASATSIPQNCINY